MRRNSCRYFPNETDTQYIVLGKITLYCKGADLVIYERLSAEDGDTLREKTTEHLDVSLMAQLIQIDLIIIVVMILTFFFRANQDLIVFLAKLGQAVYSVFFHICFCMVICTFFNFVFRFIAIKILSILF